MPTLSEAVKSAAPSFIDRSPGYSHYFPSIISCVSSENRQSVRAQCLRLTVLNTPSNKCEQVEGSKTHLTLLGAGKPSRSFPSAMTNLSSSPRRVPVCMPRRTSQAQIVYSARSWVTQQKPCLPASGFALPPCHPQQARLLAAAGARPAAKCKTHARRVSLRSSGLEFVPSKAQLRCQSCVAVRPAFSMVHPNPTYQPMKCLSIRPCQRTLEWAGRTLQRPTAAEWRKLARVWACMWEEPWRVR